MMKLETDEKIATLQIEPGETVKIVYHPDGYNSPIDRSMHTLPGLIIGTKITNSGRMVLTITPHRNHLYVGNNQLILLDDQNEPDEISISWQYGLMELKKLELSQDEILK